MSKMLISSTGNPKKNVFFLQVFRDFNFLLRNFSTHLTMHGLKCFFHMDNHIYLVVTVTFVNIFMMEFSGTKKLNKLIFLISSLT